MEASCIFFRYDYHDVFILWVTPTLDIPMLDCSDDVRLIQCPKLNFDFVSYISIYIFQQQVKLSTAGLTASSIPSH